MGHENLDYHRTIARLGRSLSHPSAYLGISMTSVMILCLTSCGTILRDVPLFVLLKSFEHRPTRPASLPALRNSLRVKEGDKFGF